MTAGRIILYFGDNNPYSTSSHRANALVRLGYKVIIYNPYDALGRAGSKIEFALHYRTGFRFVQRKIKQWLSSILTASTKPDLIWINSGELFGPDCLKFLRLVGCPVVLYNNDDPTGFRDGRRFDSLLRAIPYFDLCVVMRDVNIREYLDLGAKRVVRVRMSYDEIAHNPLNSSQLIRDKYQSDVAFIGAWRKYDNRDRFLLDLIKQGINVNIWGDHWHKSPNWKALQPHFKGPALNGSDYVAAIQGANICLGLLSKGNRDQHTQRSVEIPFAGGLLCAERTQEHLELFRDEEEAIFWSDSRECASVCRKLLLDGNLRRKIVLGGMDRIRQLSIGNEDTCRKIMEVLNDTGSPLTLQVSYPLYMNTADFAQNFREK